MEEQKEKAGQKQLLDDAQLHKVTGGHTEEEIKRMAKMTCPYCETEFKFLYSMVITCPNCWRELPIWQDAGYGVKKISVEEWDAWDSTH